MTEKTNGLSVDQVRAQGAVFGTGDALKTQALSVLLEATVGNPAVYATTYRDAPSTGSSLLDAVVSQS